MTETIKTLNIRIPAIAKICHEANKAYCEAIEDNSQVGWHDCEQWQKDSAIMGVTTILENPDITPQEVHEAWMKAKIADGWKYGKIKDAEKKIHYGLKEYENVYPEQKIKDILFSNIVRSFVREKAYLP